MQIGATISPITPYLEGVVIARSNGAFGTFEQMESNIRPYQKNGIFTFVDIPNGRKKIRTNTYSDDEIIKFAEKIGANYLALSYVKSAADLVHKYPTIAKIETVEGLQNIDEISLKADMILIDRRDLATSIGIVNIPFAVEKIVDAAHRKGKKVILASELLLSMLDNNEPTIAEVENIARAKGLGLDYILLAEETAIGKNPQYIVNVASELC